MIRILWPVNKLINVYHLKETKRFAGHSKWANIKHIKAEKDSEKAIMTDKHLRQMRAAITEGGSANPEKNPKLAYLLEQAKKKQIPNGTVKAFLEKMQSSKESCHNVWINISGPNKSLIVVHLVTDNTERSRHNINTMLRKHMCKLADGSVKAAFDIIGIIMTEKFCNLDAATDIGIDIGAEDVLEIEKDDKEYLKFICDPDHLLTVKRNLEKVGHAVISAEEDYIPRSLVELNDEALDQISKLYDKLRATGELIKIYDNIA